MFVSFSVLTPSEWSSSCLYLQFYSLSNFYFCFPGLPELFLEIITYDWLEWEESISLVFINIFGVAFGLVGCLPEIFGACVCVRVFCLFSSVCCLWSYSIFPLLLLNSKPLRSLLSGSAKNHKLQPWHMKWARMQLRSTSHNSVEAVQTVVRLKAAHACAYLVSIHHWLWEVLSYSQIAETFTWFQLVGGILQVWICVCLSSFFCLPLDLSLWTMFAFSPVLQLFVSSEPFPQVTDDLYIEGLSSGDSPVDDEGGDDNDVGSGSGSGDYRKNTLAFLAVVVCYFNLILFPVFKVLMHRVHTVQVRPASA